MSDSRAQVCAVITEATVDAARTAMNHAVEVADMIELRLDFLRDFDFSDANSLRTLLEDRAIPVIITCRAASEGGSQRVDDQLRIRLLVEGAKRFGAYCDIEASSYIEAASLSPDVSRMIVSYHNCEETPVDLDRIYDRVTALPAAVHKIVTRANDVTDSLAIFKLFERGGSEGKKLIAIAMGPAGVITRVLGPSRGSYLTYGSLAPGKESAEGQFTCEELIDLYRLRRMSRETSVAAIIGSPVAHSASPAMHNRAFAELGLDSVYLPLEVEDLEGFVRRMVRPDTREIDWNLRGFSVTIPHKTAIIPLLDELDHTARAVGAVNTVVVREGGRLAGYNTDVRGVIDPLEKIHALEGEWCGVIGAGGAARAAIYGLLERGARVTLFARNKERGSALSESFAVEVLPIESLATSDINVVINATPVGMRGHSEGESPIPSFALRGRAVAYDLVYNPLETRFLADARAQGCRTISGIEMLLAQAALQFELWTGQKPPREVMREAARAQVAGKTRN